jgi:hypothetical protein
MELIKAIETKYNGYRFRSRLEARWAVVFDWLDISYEYEPEGFDLTEAWKEYGKYTPRLTGKGDVWYLPDFYLPDYSWYVEVKPSVLTEDAKPGVDRAVLFSRAKRLIILAGPPGPESYTGWAFDLKRKGETRTLCISSWT